MKINWDIFLENTKLAIENLKMPEHWVLQGAEVPNSMAKKHAFHVCFLLYKEHDLKPKVIACTIESGVYLKFISGDTQLLIETYNDGQIAALIDKDKQTLFSEDIVSLNFDKCINIFKKTK